MKIELFCQNTDNEQMYDVSDLAGNMQFSTVLRGNPGKFVFSLLEDPNEILQLSAGSIISLKLDGEGIFYGYLFSYGTDASGMYKLTTYDQLRYLQNQDTMYIPAMTASDRFGKICKDNGVKSKILTPSSFIVPENYHNNESYYTMMEDAIIRSNIAEGKQYFIKDDFGTLLFTELAQYKTNLILGDESLVTSYQYELSIDSDTFNYVKVIRDNEKTGKRDVWVEFDSSTQKKWGKLQYLVEAEEGMNESQIKQLAANILKAKNRITQGMKISVVAPADALVGMHIGKFTAGTSFRLRIDKLGILQDTWVISAEHIIDKDTYFLNLEVFV